MIADVAAIVARGMGIRRGGRWLLRPATFGVCAGVIGVAGPPGVGKSILLATFATLRRPQVGNLEILGLNTGKTTELRKLRSRLGYLPDPYYWADSLTVGELIGYAAYYRRVPARRAALDRFDLGELADRELGLLPADVRLRAGVAAACVHRPELVLLDEPLAAFSEAWPGADDRPYGTVDAGPGPAAGYGIEPPYALIRSLAPTVLVTAANPESLTGWCDRVFLLARGRLTEFPARSARTAVRPASAPVGAPPRLAVGSGAGA